MMKQETLVGVEVKFRKRATDINSLVPKKKGAAIVRGIERFLELFAYEPKTIRIDLAVVTLSRENIKLVQYVPGIFSHE